MRYRAGSKLLIALAAAAAAAIVPCLGGKGAVAEAAPTIVSSHRFAGQFSTAFTPGDAAGAIGTTRYIQLTRGRYGIYNRSTHAVIASGPIGAFWPNEQPVGQFRSPQIIWDATSNRFYFAMIADTVSPSGFYLIYGFSKTASPSVAGNAGWCHYFRQVGGAGFGIHVDSIGLGDTQHYWLLSYSGPSYAGTQSAELYILNKPPAGTACPPDSAMIDLGTNLSDGSRALVAPVPANQIDPSPTGYVIGRNQDIPSQFLYLISISRNETTGNPVIGFADRFVVPSFDVPPDARQNTLTQKLDTLDARLGQAVLARNPRRQNSPFSVWTQHTVENGALSAIRWYEIDPATVPDATVLRTGLISAPGNFYYNGAISPDRRVDGGIRAFGGSFVIGYNVSSATNGIWPRIGMASSVNGGPLSSVTVSSAVGPYRDKSCPNTAQVCAWGKQAGAAPDPRPETTGTGAVWLTTQFAGSTSTSTTQGNWRTRIWAAKP